MNECLLDPGLFWEYYSNKTIEFERSSSFGMSIPRLSVINMSSEYNGWKSGSFSFDSLS